LSHRPLPNEYFLSILLPLFPTSLAAVAGRGRVTTGLVRVVEVVSIFWRGGPGNRGLSLFPGEMVDI